MARFCGKCGAKLDEQTGFCPNCDAAQLARSKANQSVNLADGDVQKERPISRKEKRKQKKLEKKAAKKEKKRQKRAAMTFGQKVRKFFLKLLLVLLLLVVLTVSAAGVLVYFDLVDIPIIAIVLEKAGITPPISFESQKIGVGYIPKEENVVYEDTNQNFGYVNNMVLVFAYSDVADEKLLGIAEELDGQIVGKIESLHQYQIEVTPMSREELESVCEKAMTYEEVKYAIVDDVVTMETEALKIPDDPWKDVFQGIFGVDWTEEKPDGTNWWMEATKVPSAWQYDDNFSEFNVGVVDNGFDTMHEDLSIEVLNDDVNNAEDHGTHVSGIIGATANNGIGINGVLDNVNLYGVDCYATSNQKRKNVTVSSLLGGIQLCINHGCKIVNMSSVIQTTTANETRERAQDTAHNAIIYLICMLDLSEMPNDFMIVQAAGNDGIHANYAGYFAAIDEELVKAVFNEFDERDIQLERNITVQDVLDSYMVVGAVDKKQKDENWQLAEFSNYGDKITVCAPGVNVFSTSVMGGLDGNYKNDSGTSMASPIVAGIAAMVWSVDPNMRAGDVKNIITTTADNGVLGRRKADKSTYGMINACAAVEAALALKEKGDADNGISLDKPQYMPIDAVEFNGHYYYLYDLDTVTGWAAAQQYCQEQGGHLATITSAEEDAFLYSYMRQKGCDSAMFGLTDQDADDDWKWVTGEEFSYYNWHTGEPNHQGGYEHYGMYYREMTDGTWNDGDGRDGPFLCEWEDASARRPIPTASKERDIVLVLDGSGSMGGTPIEETQKAANKFVDTILGEHANVGMVVYDDDVRDSVNISADPYPLKEALTDLSAGGGTNIEEGLVYAKQMLDSGQAKKKIIVLMSDGAPTTGKTDDELVAYANSLKKEGILIYTIGFFGSNTGSASYEQQLMEHIASEGCHYEVANTDELVYFFEDIGDQISGQKYIYVRIACPVDVSVRHNGQVLNSAAEKLSTRTKFGTLTLENQVDGDENNQIKVLRLKEGADYHVEIVGTGRGLMNYTIGFMDEDGEYSDFRKFENIRVTKRTVVDTVAAVKKESTLNIDEDGDGKYDIRLKAGANEYGEEVKSVAAVYIAIASVVLLIILIRFVVIKINGKQKEKEKK